MITPKILQQNKQKNKLVVILGPTASGKTDLAIKLARKFNGEIVCADSRQIYKNMLIGTASPLYEVCPRTDCTRAELVQSINHHLFHFREPNKPLNVALYKKMAEKTIKDIQKQGKLPFLVGGTGLYIKAIADNLKFPKLKPSQKIRKKLESKTADELFAVYKKLDPKGALKIDKNNKRRLIRAIEVCQITGKPFWEQRQKQAPLFDVLQIGIKLPKKELEKRISQRVEKMLKQGLAKEAKALFKKYGIENGILNNTIGYAECKELNSFQFANNLTPCKYDNKQATAEKIKLHTIQFSKRQMTWFCKDKKIRWAKNQTQAEKLVKNFTKLDR